MTYETIRLAQLREWLANASVLCIPVNEVAQLENEANQLETTLENETIIMGDDLFMEIYEPDFFE